MSAKRNRHIVAIAIFCATAAFIVVTLVLSLMGRLGAGSADVVVLVASLALLAIEALVFLRLGPPPAPTFQEQYWRDVPDPTIHPLIVQWLMQNRTIAPRNFATEMMHLSAQGAVYLGVGHYPLTEDKAKVLRRNLRKARRHNKPTERYDRALATATVNGYYVSRLPGAKKCSILSDIDRESLALLFGTVGKGEDSIWLSAIRDYAERDRSQASTTFVRWSGKVEEMAQKYHLVETEGKLPGTVLVLLAVALGLVGVVYPRAADATFALYVAPILAAVVVGAISVKYLPYCTGRGAELVAKAEALRAWLKDFTALSDRPPADVKVWGNLMVYATAFGIAREVMDKLKEVLPDVYAGSMVGGSDYSGNWGEWFNEDADVTDFGDGDIDTAFDDFDDMATDTFDSDTDGADCDGD